MIKTGNTQQLAEAQSIAAQAGDWLWGVLQGDFNENPTTSQIVVGTIISMIPVVDQLMDVRDICANVMLLTDDDETNDTGAWIAFTLTGIGLVPTVGSAAKGVGKVIIKNADESLSAALATIRKLGKGDPVQFIRDINWSSLCATAAAEVKNILKGLRDALDEAAKSWTYDIILPDVAIEGMQNTVRQIDEVLPKIEQNMQKAAEHIDNKVSKALDKYEGEPPISGVTNVPNSAKAPELEPPKGNDLPGAKHAKRVRNPILEEHYQNLEAYEKHYTKRMNDAIKNGDSNSRIGAFKAKLTEVKGERAASAYMEKHFSKPPPPAQMELGFGPGPGVDQIWAKRDKDGNILEYFIVEAKGPGAKLGKMNDGTKQMSDEWIKRNLNRMKNSKKYEDKNKLGQDLLDAIEDKEPDIKKLVIEAVEDNGKVIGGKLQPLPKN